MRKEYKVEFLLCLFLGWIGVHRFYKKEYGVGILYVFTAGGILFGWLYDTIRLFKLAVLYDDNKVREYEENIIKKKKEFERIMESNPTVSKPIPNNQPCCPKCGSTQLTANKKGFSLGKALVGGIALVPIAGVATGMIGKNKIIITCLNCGKQFKPGK